MHGRTRECEARSGRAQINMFIYRAPVPMRLREIPVPIPNTMVKTQAADGTMLATAWKSRRVPGHFFFNLCYTGEGLETMPRRLFYP